MHSRSVESRGRTKRRRGRASLACALLIAFAMPMAAQADTETDARRARRLAYEGRCEQAIPVIQAVRAAEDTAPMALLEAQCHIRLRDYATALTALDAAQRMDPALEDLALARVIALFQLGELDEARVALEDAQRTTSARSTAQLELYTGLLDLQAEEYREAAQALDRARALDAAQVEPIASFYAGLAWQGAGERVLARESLLRVQAADPDGPWGRRAGELLAGRSLEERSWISIEAGLEYDSNVVLLGEQVVAPQGISDQADGRGVWFLDAGVELFNVGDWSGGIVATYAGNAQFRLNQFDIQYPRGGGWIDNDLDENHVIRLRYNIGYAWVDYSPFLLTQDASLTLFRNWGAGGNTELGLGWIWNDYRFFIAPVPQANAMGQCPPFVVNTPCAPAGFDAQAARDRSGNSVRPLLLHRYRVLPIDNDVIRDVEIRGGYAYERYFAKGQDWDYQSHDFIAGLKALLYWGLELDSQLSYSYRPFDNPSSFPNPPQPNGQPFTFDTRPRLDHIVSLGVYVEKPIDEHWSVSTRYLFTRQNSTAVAFDYTRHIVGGYLKYRF